MNSRVSGARRRSYSRISDGSRRGSVSERGATGCRIVMVGGRRGGGKRYWCLQHMANATGTHGRREAKCVAAHTRIPKPVLLNIDQYRGGIALWGAVPAVYDTTRQAVDRGIHTHARRRPTDTKEIDKTYRAIRLCGGALPPGGVIVSELDAIHFMVSSVFELRVQAINCRYCGYPHLDRDYFSVHTHHRHLCAACGKYFEDGRVAISNQLGDLQRLCGFRAQEIRPATRTIALRQENFAGGIQVWGSNAALLWTGEGHEEEGIHIHAYDNGSPNPVIDETYAEVSIDGVSIDPSMVRLLMAQNALPHLDGRIRSINCTRCTKEHYSQGAMAYTPTATHTCISCGNRFSAPGRFKKTIANPLVAVLARLGGNAPRAPRILKLNLSVEKPR